MTNRYNARVSHQSLSAVDDSKDASPNMIGEQILELRDGLNSFQANAFESLYDKKVSWVKETEPATISIPVSEESVAEVISDSEVKIIVPEVAKIPADDTVDETPVAKSTIIVKPITVVDKVANIDVIAVRNIPVRPPPEESEELAAENRKRAIIKAQQAVTQSFLSLDSFASAPEPEPESVPAVTSAMEPAVVSGKNTKPESVAGGFFSFLKSDNAVQNIANLKPTAPPSVAKAFMTPVAAARKTTDNVDSDEKKAAMMSRPSISDLKTESSPKILTTETDEAPIGGFFGFLKQPTSNPENLIVKMAPKAVVVKVEPIVVKEVEEMKKSPSSGFFSFLNSDPNIAVPTSKPSTSNTVKALIVVPEEISAPVTTSPPKSSTITPPAAGLFGFLKSAPVPEVKKAPVVAVVAQIPSPAPVSAPKVSVAAPQSGGFFGFLNPGPGSSKTQTAVVPTEEVIAPATAKKITVNVPAAKTSRPVAAAPVAKVSPAIPESGGLFGFLSPKGSESKKSEPVIKEVTVPEKATLPVRIVAVPAKPVESKAVAMNVKFQTSVSKLLKGDGNKIKTFQRATDDFRSDDVSGENFIETLITLFGADALESVIVPLISELPERKMSVKLQTAYDKKVKAIKNAENPAKSPFSFSFGAAPKKNIPTPVQAASLVALLPIASISEKKFMSGGPRARVPVTTLSVKEAVFKVPSKVPVAKKLSIERQMKSLLSGSTDAKTFYSTVSKELGKEKTKEVMPDIIAAFPAEIRTKIEPIFRADK